MRPFLILLIAMAFGGLTYRATSVILPSYFESMDFKWHGLMASLAYGLGSLGQYAGGRLADRFDLRAAYLGFHVLSIPFVFSLFLMSGLPVFAAAGLFIFFNMGMQPIENSLVAKFTPERWRSTGYGMKFTLVFSIGATSVPMVRRIGESYSLPHVFLGVGVAVILMLVVSCLLVMATRGIELRNRPADEDAADVATIGN